LDDFHAYCSCSVISSNALGACSLGGLAEFFLLVSFVNLSVLDENSPPEVPLVFASLAEEDVQGSLFNVVEQLKARLSRLCCALT